jgi:hypothetical protein
VIVFLAAFLYLHVSEKNLLEALLHKKSAQKMLMKLSPGLVKKVCRQIMIQSVFLGCQLTAVENHWF